jgi:hypothetical protein
MYTYELSTLSVRPSHVSQSIAGDTEPCIAELTHVRSLAGVYSHVEYKTVGGAATLQLLCMFVYCLFIIMLPSHTRRTRAYCAIVYYYCVVR